MAETERVFDGLRPEARRLRPAGRDQRRPVHPSRRHLLRRPAPTWSNRTVRAIAREELAAARRVGIIDFHTGLGPFGHGELICAVAPAAKSFARAKAWYGDEMTSPEGGTSTSAVVVGVMTDAFPQELPDAEVTSIAIEYGTYTVPEVLGAVRADNWLHQRGDLKLGAGQARSRPTSRSASSRPATNGARWCGRAPTRRSAGRSRA